MPTLEIIMKELKAQGKSQSELASGIGISKNTVTNWKSGASNSYLKMLPQISDYLNVSVDYLIGKTDERHGEKPAGEDIDDSLRQLHELVDKIPKDYWNDAEEILRIYVNRSKEKK